MKKYWIRFWLLQLTPTIAIYWFAKYQGYTAKDSFMLMLVFAAFWCHGAAWISGIEKALLEDNDLIHKEITP